MALSLPFKSEEWRVGAFEISEALRAELSPRCGLVRSGMDHVNDFLSFARGITYTHGGSNLLGGS